VVPLYADCLLRCASDLDGDMLTARDHVAVKTATEQRQARERERYQRQTAFAAYRMSGKRSILPLTIQRAAMTESSSLTTGWFMVGKWLILLV